MFLRRPFQPGLLGAINARASFKDCGRCTVAHFRSAPVLTGSANVSVESCAGHLV